MTEQRANIGAVKLISMDETTAIVGGYGVVFGGRDLEGDTFAPDTDFRLDLVPAKMVFYDHTLGDVQHDLGRVTNDAIKIDDNGMWIEAQLDRSAAYVDEVLKLIEAGVLGWSSGSIAHLARRKGNVIKSWPIVEFSLTPIPAEPRTLGVERIKALAAVYPNLEALQESAGKALDNATETATVAVEIKSEEMEKPIMSEQDKVEATAPAADNSEVLAAIGQLAETVKSVSGRLEAIEKTPVNAVSAASKSVNIIEPTSLGDEKKNYRKAYWTYMGSLGRKALKALEHGVDAEGGYAVPEDDEMAINSIAVSMSAVRQLPVQERNTSVVLYHWPTITTHTGAMTSTAEEAAYNQNDPVFGEALFTIAKYTRRIIVSEELIGDTNSGLQQALNRQFGEALALTENSILITRLAAASTSTVTFATNSAITAAEVVEMYYANADPYPTNGWLMRKATEGAIRGVSGNDFHFLPNPQGQLQSSLMGSPVVNASGMSAIGTTATSVYTGDWSQVGIVRNGGLSISFNPYLSQATGQVDFFASARFDIQVLQASALVDGTHPV